MATELIISPEAAQDLEESYQWYERQRLGLGEEFLGCVDACIQGVCRMPEMNEILFEEYRRGLVRRFPYAVYYELREQKVIVYAVFHAARNPAKWRERLSEK